MAWVSVHQEVDGTKLRRLYQKIGCSKFEALGILNFVWFWGLKNADETGLAKDADLEVLSRYLYGCGEGSDLNMKQVANALIDTGWIESGPAGIIIHDWDQWQEQWYKLQRNRKYEAERKRKSRAGEGKKTNDGEAAPPEQPEAKPEKPEKKQYAELVWMTEDNYTRLVQLYGEKFAKECISKLDQYKGSKGKTYKDDYRAILSWVVDRVKQAHPELIQRALPPGRSWDSILEETLKEMEGEQE